MVAGPGFSAGSSKLIRHGAIGPDSAGNAVRVDIGVEMTGYVAPQRSKAGSTGEIWLAPRPKLTKTQHFQSNQRRITSNLNQLSRWQNTVVAASIPPLERGIDAPRRVGRARERALNENDVLVAQPEPALAFTPHDDQPFRTTPVPQAKREDTIRNSRIRAEQRPASERKPLPFRRIRHRAGAIAIAVSQREQLGFRGGTPIQIWPMPHNPTERPIG